MNLDFVEEKDNALPPFMAKNPLFRKLSRIDVNTLTPEEHAKYDPIIKVMRDNICIYQAALREGYMIGLKESVRKGKQEGIQEVARMILASGMPLEQVATILKIDAEELEKQLKE